ncbi:alpha/beta hydrolase fold domain-containing protein [Streptomyces sp. NPDC002577]
MALLGEVAADSAARLHCWPARHARPRPDTRDRCRGRLGGLSPGSGDPLGPVEDCYAGLVWLAQHADEVSIDPQRIMVAGISAGGGLAAVTAGPRIPSPFPVNELVQTLVSGGRHPRAGQSALRAPTRDRSTSSRRSHATTNDQLLAQDVSWSTRLGSVRGGSSPRFGLGPTPRTRTRRATASREACQFHWTAKGKGKESSLLATFNV